MKTRHLDRNKKVGFLTECSEDSLEFLVAIVFTKVFDIDIGELHSFGAKLNLSFLTRLEVANEPVHRINLMNHGTINVRIKD